jgi:hypothetical protein
MNNNDERDYAEEQANRAEWEREATTEHRDAQGRAYTKWATPYVLATAERDVCSYCLRELVILDGRDGRDWGNALVYEDERYTNGVHACYPVGKLAENYLVDFHYDVWYRDGHIIRLA